jgi:hypothetical protein
MNLYSDHGRPGPETNQEIAMIRTRHMEGVSPYALHVWGATTQGRPYTGESPLTLPSPSMERGNLVGAPLDWFSVTGSGQRAGTRRGQQLS